MHVGKPLGCGRGKYPGPRRLRSHGGRHHAVLRFHGKVFGFQFTFLDQADDLLQARGFGA